MDAGTRRRRGAALEDAILDAAWVELIEQGYADMTLESVAKRAGTSRPVLHRRWPSRTKLATAALGRYLALNPIDVPDLGSIRSEMAVLLRGLSDRARPDLTRLIVDMTGDLAESNSNLADIRGKIANDRLIRTILDRGVERGEIDPSRLTPRIVSLPTDLARHEMLMTLKPLSDEVILEIVEEVVLPLVRCGTVSR
ncbi:TetR/AcrR family transcriptional regulator [Agrobacterium vitis]|uniref:TetR/AcrR family transcriptional regulator n=1 Tax=Rhizobium/Agrobacterium group TaxID=227290 RepID=UPI001F311DA8|nr:TetR/AcrR family transcriptional regulator [Allorhizobium ampelinum]MCF1485147.1 TetR/AcrR family transcriptional regulator [Allorhizobium ampelinum]